MLSLITASVFFVISSYIGMGLQKYYLKRKKIAAEYAELVDYLEAEIIVKTPSPLILKQYSKRCSSLLYPIVITLLDKIERADLNTDGICSLLNKTENELLFQPLLALGGQGRIDEKSRVESLRKKTAQFSKKCEGEYEKEGKLCLKLSILIGIALMIIIV